MGISPPTQKAIYAEAAKRHFKEGKSEGFRDYMTKLNAPQIKRALISMNQNLCMAL